MSLENRVELLFQELRRPLYRYLLMLVWDAAESEELAQESFLRLYRRLLAGEKIENVKAWLFRVAHNLAIDRGRTSRSLDSLSQDLVRERVETLHAGVIETPEQAAFAGERWRRLASAVSCLSERQRQCLDLRAEGFRYREIAEILGVEEATVFENVRRAIRRLTKELHVSE